MKLPEDDIPEAIILDLFFEDLLFCLSDSEPVTIFLDELPTIPFADPEAEIVPDHGTDDGRDDREGKMISCPESSDEDHDIHPRNGSSNDRKWLDTGRCERDQVIPWSELLDEFPHPDDRRLDPFRMDERYDHYTKCEECECDRESLGDEWESFFEHEKRALWWL